MEKVKGVCGSRDKEIVATANNFLRNLSKSTTQEKTQQILKLVELYKQENEEMKFSFYDKDGERILNCPFGIAGEGHIKQLASGLLLGIHITYFGKPDDSLVYREDSYPAREVAVIRQIYGCKPSAKILRRNGYGYNEQSSYQNDFVNDEEEAFCKAVLSLLFEITIRSYIFNKYSTVTEEEAQRIYRMILDYYEKNKEEADRIVDEIRSTSPQKTIRSSKPKTE